MHILHTHAFVDKFENPKTTCADLRPDLGQMVRARGLL